MTLPNPPLWLILVGFVCALGPLVFFHELGHYLVARMFRIPAEIFSIGFGRELVGWTDRQGTRWKVAWLPLGGYVRFVGDMGPASNPGDLDHVPLEMRDRVFQLRPVWQRFLVVLAGPAANFLLAILIYAAFFAFFSVPNPSNEVGSVQRHTAAEAAGLLPGDRNLSVAGKETVTSTISAPSLRPCRTEWRSSLTAAAKRLRSVKSAPGADGRQRQAAQVGFLGVGPERASVIEAVPMAVSYTGKITVMMVEGIARLITGGGSREEVGGPIKIAQIAGQAASLGVFAFANLLALFSINLGFINLLPVPMLDGGHLFFYTVEAVRRRPLSARASMGVPRGTCRYPCAAGLHDNQRSRFRRTMGPASALDWIGRLGQGTTTGAGGGARRGTNCTKGGDG